MDNPGIIRNTRHQTGSDTGRQARWLQAAAPMFIHRFKPSCEAPAEARQEVSQPCATIINVISS